VSKRDGERGRKGVWKFIFIKRRARYFIVIVKGTKGMEVVR
jgi:hypothetical protein